MKEIILIFIAGIIVLLLLISYYVFEGPIPVNTITEIELSECTENPDEVSLNQSNNYIIINHSVMMGCNNELIANYSMQDNNIIIHESELKVGDVECTCNRNVMIKAGIFIKGNYTVAIRGLTSLGPEKIRVPGLVLKNQTFVME